MRDMVFIVFFTDNAVPKTGLSPVIDIWTVAGVHTVNNQAMTEIVGGFYKYDFTAYNATLDYVIRADSVILTGAERYAYSSNEHKVDVSNLPENIDVSMDAEYDVVITTEEYEVVIRIE